MLIVTFCKNENLSLKTANINTFKRNIFFFVKLLAKKIMFLFSIIIHTSS